MVVNSANWVVLEQFKQICNRWRLLQIAKAASGCIGNGAHCLLRLPCLDDFRYTSTDTFFLEVL
jgi:hypothetical protein